MKMKRIFLIIMCMGLLIAPLYSASTEKVQGLNQPGALQGSALFTGTQKVGKVQGVTAGSAITTWTSDLCTGGTITSWKDFAGYGRTYAFDDDTTLTEFWYPGTLSDNTPPLSEPWIAYQLSAGKKIEKVNILAGNTGEYGGNRAKTVIIAGSNNGSDWTDLYTCNLTNTAAAQAFTFDNDTSYTYYRLFVTDSYAQNGGYYLVGIAEVEMMETTPTAGAYD